MLYGFPFCIQAVFTPLVVVHPGMALDPDGRSITLLPSGRKVLFVFSKLPLVRRLACAPADINANVIAPARRTIVKRPGSGVASKLIMSSPEQVGEFERLVLCQWTINSPFDYAREWHRHPWWRRS